MDELATILGELQAAGKRDSSGVFTVDVRKALPKLERFQLPRPEFGMLKVVQSAVAAGASRITVEVSPVTLSLAHDGEPPLPEELEGLLGYLMAPDFPSHRRSLRDLAIGVNTALARGGSWVEVSTRGPDGWSSQRWRSREEVVESTEGPGRGWATVKFSMRKTAGQAVGRMVGLAKQDIGALLKGEREALQSDEQTIYDRCRNCPIPIWLNGREVPPPDLGRRTVKRWGPFDVREHRSPNLLELYLQTREPSAHLLSLPTESTARARYLIEGHLDGDEWTADGEPTRLTGPAPTNCCFAIIALRGRPHTPPRLTLVKDGVDLTDLSPRGMPNGTYVVATAEGLTLDLSQFRLVRGAGIEERVQYLSSCIQVAARLAMAAGESLDEAQQQALQQLLQG